MNAFSGFLYITFKKILGFQILDAWNKVGFSCISMWYTLFIYFFFIYTASKTYKCTNLKTFKFRAIAFILNLRIIEKWEKFIDYFVKNISFQR
jgi:hypothetical protein